MVINAFIVIVSLVLFCLYSFSGKLFLFMYPNWVLLVNALLGAIGLSISVLFCKRRIGFRIFALLILLVWIFPFVSYVLGIRL